MQKWKDIPFPCIGKVTIIKMAIIGEFQKKIYFCFLDYAKAFDSVGHNKLWIILKEIWIPDHLTCLLRNLYAGQKSTARTHFVFILEVSDGGWEWEYQTTWPASSETCMQVRKQQLELDMEQ